MTKMVKEFSRKYVLSQNINFTKLYQEVEYYNGKSVQPLFVVMLKTLEDLYQFGDTTKLYNMGLHTWLVIFMESNDRKFNDFCREPRDNVLNLVVSTKMLAKCYNNPLLKEWYSMDEKKIEVSEYGMWSIQKGVTKLSEKNFYERRSNFKGISLKVSTVKEVAPIPDWNGSLNSFFGMVFKELSSTMNFKMEFISEEDYYGTWNETEDRWTGVIGRLEAREIDIGIGEFTMSQQRADVVDYTVPLMLSHSDLYIKRPNMSNVDWSAYVKAFHTNIWGLIVVILVITPILLAIMCRISKGSDVSRCYLLEEYLAIWSIYCQKSLPDFPASSSLRIAYLSVFLSSLVLFAVYSAYLTSYLTVFTPSIPFNTFGGFVKDGTYKLIILRHSSNHDLFTRSKIPIISKMGKLLKADEDLPHDIFAALKQVCNERVVLYTNQLFIEKVSRYSPCVLTSLTQGRLDNVGFVLAKNSPYTEIFNYNLKNLRAFGIVECLKRRYLRKFIFDDSSYLPVALWSVIPILGILCLGIVVSLQFLICECIVKQKYVTLINQTVKSKSQNKETFKTLTTMFRISRCFSDHNVLVQTARLSNVRKYLKYYKYRTLSPLYIITLKSQLDLEEFSNFAKNFTMSMNLWLVFIYKSPELLKFCQKPDRNLFNVMFNTKILIKCENDPIIKEWYSVRGVEVKVNSVARWTVNEGFVMVNTHSMWQRRKRLDNITIRIATVRESPFTMADHAENRDTLYGLFGSVLRELKDMANFTAELIAAEDYYGSYEPMTGKWSGVIGRLVSKEVDIGVAEFGRSKHRMDIIDFTVPLLLTRMSYYMKQPNMSAIMWSTYTQVLDHRIWTIYLFAALVCSFLIAVIMSKLKSKKIIPLTLDNCFYVWGIQCQQSLPEFPTASSLKIAFMSLVIPSMVIYISYSAALTSYLAVFNPNLPFTTEQEFTSDKSYNLTVLRGSVYHDIFERSNGSLALKMRERLKRPEDLPLNMFEAIKQVCNEQVVFCTNELFVDKISANIPCTLMSISSGRLDSAAFVLTKHSPYTGLLNYYIENFRSHGIIKVLSNRHLSKMVPQASIYVPVSFQSVVPILALFFSGVGLSLFILTGEYVIWYSAKMRKRGRS
ncbi:hypothetical protein TSAR_006447 [Trichomalopsis sarcophagae]|uniref:Ionotropic glutamate receptor L-glutamate and glycine-binding domain-containing protein n=1 Tax=Trichomalopsis sarcophagae TaxID=543379 RepID=A0A232FGY0_9HYME|nr:hypothetical protein TSAR_006447 [Trichomalopsis sarcophagae]